MSAEPVPSPADWKTRGRPTTTTNTRDSLPAPETPPWLAPLDNAYRAAQAEIARLRVLHQRDMQKLYDARVRLERWHERQAAWTRERNALLAEIRRLGGG